MELDNRTNYACPCCNRCRDCKRFQEIAHLKNLGLIIYRYTTRTNDDTTSNTDEDVFILHNTKDVKIRSDEIVHEFEPNKVTCLRCKKIYEHAQRLMQNLTSIARSKIIGICNHCKLRNEQFHRSCKECEDIVCKFIVNKGDRLEKSKLRVPIKGSQKEFKKMDSREYSELFNERFKENLPRSTQKPEISQLFYPTHGFGSTDSSFTNTECYFPKDNEINEHSKAEEDHTSEAWKLNKLNKQSSSDLVRPTLGHSTHTICKGTEKTFMSNIRKYNSEGIMNGSAGGAENILKKDFCFSFPTEEKHEESTKVVIKKLKNTHVLKTEVRKPKQKEELKMTTEKKRILKKDDKDVDEKKHGLDNKEKQDLEKNSLAENKKQKFGSSKDKSKLTVVVKKSFTEKENKQIIEKNNLSTEHLIKSSTTKKTNKIDNEKTGTDQITSPSSATNKAKLENKIPHDFSLNSKEVSTKKETDKLKIIEKNNLNTEHQIKSSTTKKTNKIDKENTGTDQITSPSSAKNKAKLENKIPHDFSLHSKEASTKTDTDKLKITEIIMKQAAEKKNKELESTLKNQQQTTMTSEKHILNKKQSEDLLQLRHSIVTDIQSTSTHTFSNSQQINEQMKNTQTQKNAEIIIGQSILKYKPPTSLKRAEPSKAEQKIKPILFQSVYQEEIPIEQDDMSETEKVNLKHSSTKDVKSTAQEPKGIVRFALSDRTFIDKGWTILPTEKVVRKMNVYRMRPAHPEFNWFNNHKNKGEMHYDTGDKLAEFDESGRGRWFYRNGQLALDYYDAKEVNAQQRFVVYSSGEPDERGRSHPITILATFDYLGNGIVFDHNGKIRLKYNQTEGVVLDREIGPVSHWKWHSLNDPPVLQQVMIDTEMRHKDPVILNLGGGLSECKPRPDNEEMLEIEFDNFINEKAKKLSQIFKPFQIKMKALKINKYFSLRVIDQSNIYLIFRDGSTNLKLNIGMLLDHQEIIDTDTAEVGEVSNKLEQFPAHTDSLARLQRSILNAQRFEQSRMERERRRVRPSEYCKSADKLTAASSRPLRTVLYGSTTAAGDYCKWNRKPTNNLYCNTYII